MSEPFELRAEDLLTLGPIGGQVSGINGQIATAGMILWARFGQVFYYCNYGSSAVYVVVEPKPEHQGKRGKVFAHSKMQFGKEISFGAADQLSVTLAGTRKVMEIWLDLYMGCMACMSGPGGLAVKGFQGLVSAGKLYQNYDALKKGIFALMYNERYVRDAAPALYAHVLASLIYGKLEAKLKQKVTENIINGTVGNNIAGKLVGVFAEKLGEDPFKKRLTTINSLFKEVLIKVAQHTYDNPGAKLSAEQIELLGNHVNKQLATVNLQLPKNYREKIVTEAAYANIRKIMLDISGALDALG